MKKTILLIEDDKILRENTRELLEFAGYNVVTATNGTSGIDKAKEHIPDVILCDIVMPETNGYGVLEILSSHHTTRYIPFIFLSAKTEIKNIRKGMVLGADDYIAKPFTEEDLIATIERRIEKSAMISRVLEKEYSSHQADTENDIRNLNELKNFFDDNGNLLSFKEGETTYSYGEHSKNVYLIIKGFVKCFRVDEKGKVLTTAIHKPDEFLGITSFYENTIYHESATALDDVHLAGISKKTLNQILGEHQNISLELMEVLNHDLEEIKEQLLHMAYGSVRRKTAQSLLYFAKAFNKKPKENMHVLRTDLASVAGIATETLIRTLSGFKRSGYLEVDKQYIRIMDQAQLELIS